MPDRKTPPPGEGRVAPPQEGGVSVEKKKVDAAFWEKFKDFQKMEPEERVPAIEAFLAQYEKVYGRENFKRDLYFMLFAHPEWCRAVAVQTQWEIEHQADMDHNPTHTESLRKYWDVLRPVKKRTVAILENVSQGIFPSDADLAEPYSHDEGWKNRDMLYALHQGAWQGGKNQLAGWLDMLGQIAHPDDSSRWNEEEMDKLEQLQWLGGMDREKMKEVFYQYHDLNEQDGFGSSKKSGWKFLLEEVQKWREGRGKE